MKFPLPTRLSLAARDPAERPAMRAFALGQRAPGVEIRLRPRRRPDRGDAGHDFSPSASAFSLMPAIVPQTGEKIP